MSSVISMNNLLLSSMLLAGASLGACGDSDPSATEDAGTPVPVECEGETIVAKAGSNQMVFSALAIGKTEDGFDLDGDGEPDNKFAAISSLTNDPINSSFDDFSLVLPMEFFDLPEVGEDECVKFAIYQGDYRLDGDGDGKDSAREDGDCNDHVENFRPGIADTPDNGIDDDCDGPADESAEVTLSTSTADTDEDGVTIADGDCDDTNALIKPGLTEVCGDGLDNDCDGVADWTNGAVPPACSPYDDNLDPLVLNDNSFDDDGAPLISFKTGTIKMVDGVLRLHSGPSVFTLALPLSSDITLDLSITGTTIEADMVMTPAGWALRNGRLGGVLDTYTMDQVRGLTVEQINLNPEDSLADAIYAEGTLGVLLGLRKGEAGTPGEGCLTPDIDVDGDGIEAFCDSTPDTDPQVVDKCVDGDGTVIMDEGTTQCSAAVDENGNLRFADGVSIAITFETTPAAF